MFSRAAKINTVEANFKGYERHGKMSQLQTKPQHARKRHITLTATRQQNTTKGPEWLT